MKTARFDRNSNSVAGRRRNSEGSASTIVLVVMLLIGMTLASYLNLVSNQSISVQRSQAWNSVIPVAEAGIEEALAHLNRNGTNRVADGWVLDGTLTNVYKERTIGDAKYQVYINALVDPPAVLAQGFVKNPQDGQYLKITRSILVNTVNDALFAKGIVAKGQIDLAGNNILSDSYDSNDPDHNTGGRYDAAKRKSNGDVATNSALIDSLNVWNAQIYGKASTGPGGTVKIGKNGSVGSKAWVDAGNEGIEPGWSTDDMNVEFPEVEVPFSSGWNLQPSGTDWIAGAYGSGNYQATMLKLSGSQKLYITNDVVLYVQGTVDLTGSAAIEIAPGASLALYVGGSFTKIFGNGIINPNSSATSFTYWGLNSNTTVDMGGNASFTGTIYAPNATLTLGGGGSTTYDFSGAAIAKEVKLNGHYQFHYDEALGAFGPRRGYTIVSWHEVDGLNGL